MTKSIKDITSTDCMKSETFCILPWMHLALKADGSFRPCAQYIGSVAADSQTLSEAWNADSYNAIRAAMLAGEKVEGCVRCYDLESKGVQSKRRSEFLRHQGEFESIQDHWQKGPLSIDLRADNICNSGCIICFPHSSSFLESEIRKNPQANFHPSFHDWVEKVDASKRREQFVAKTNMFKSEVGNLKYIYIAGGEPFLSKRAMEFIQAQVNLGQAKEQVLKISTNLTMIKEEHISLLNQFMAVELYISVDGVRELYEYIRYPCKWSQLESSLELLMNKKSEQVKVEFTPTISIFNIFGLKDLFIWRNQIAEKYGSIPIVCHSLLYGPAPLSAAALPMEMKKDAIAEIESLDISLSEFDRKQLRRVVDFLQESKPDIETIRQGQAHVEAFDKIRGNSWKEITPHLSDAYSPQSADRF